MMGRQPKVQKKLFYTQFNLDQRVPQNHIIRQIAGHIDFDFVYKQVRDTYGVKGNVSIPPPVILKLMLLLILYNVRSERELMATIPMRLDWLWFLGYDPDASVSRRGKGRSKLEYQVCALGSPIKGRPQFDLIMTQYAHIELLYLKSER